MKNISSYIYVLGLFACFEANAFDLDVNRAITELAFSSLRPEITSSNNSLTGFSTHLGEGLNVTYNDKAILSRPIVKIEEDNSKTIREATIDEPLVINDWQVSLGESDISPIPEEVINQARANTEKQKEKLAKQEVIFKENNLDKDSLVAFSEKSYEISETISSFALNDIIPLEADKKNSLNDDEMIDGIGVISSTPAPVLKLKEDLEKTIISEDKAVAKRSEKKEKDSSSLWSIATVRGKTSNRLAKIGNSKDFPNFPLNKLGNKRVDDALSNNNESANPWADDYNPSNNNSNEYKTSDTTSSLKETYSPQEKVNHWSIRGINQTDIQSGELINTSFIKPYEQENTSYNDRWINEPKAVLINSVTSKSINKNNKQSNLKNDETSEYLKADVNRNTSAQPRKLLTKIEDNKIEQSFENYAYSQSIDDKNYTLQETKPVPTNSHIALNEIRLNFRPGFADLSLQSIRLVSNFASRVAGDKKSIIEIRTSDRTPYLQSNRMTIIKQILTSNGIEEERINIISTDRDADTMVLRYVPISKEEASFINSNNKEKIKKW